ncbi:Golgi to ER traffic protein 4 -like protein, partial [Trichinella zimbabwensis]
LCETLKMNGEENTNDQISVRFLNRLNVYLSSNRFYEAHQTYRALATRWTQQRKFSSLLPILYESVGKFSEKGQNLIAEDMAGLYVVALKASKSPINCSVISNLKSIFQWMILNCKSDSQERFLNQILEWSLEVSPEYPRGHPDLHRMYVEVYHERCNFHSSIFHIMLTEDGQYIGKYLAECFLKYGVPSELDIFITQFLLRYLCNDGEKSVASDILNTYFDIAVNRPKKYPLHSFLWLLLICLETKSLPFFKFLLKYYGSSLSRDPLFTEYLDKISKRYFGVPLQENNRTSNFFGNIVRRMFLNDANDATSSTVAQLASGDANNAKSNNIPVSKPSSSSSTASSSQFKTFHDDDALD